jgi:hypothetical protein
MDFSAFSRRNGPLRARNASSDCGSPIAGVDCGSARDCGSPDCGRQKFPKKNRLFFACPGDPRLAPLDAAQRGSLRSPRMPCGSLSPLPITLHSVRVGHGRFFGEKNIPPPKNGRDAKQAPLRVRAGSERGPAHSPARRQVEGPESGRVP